MTTTTANSSAARGGRGGFTLIELMVSAAIASVVLIAVCSALIFLSRASLASTDYAGMDGQARAGLETFAREVRMANAVSSFSTSGVTLTVPGASGTYTIAYTYVPGTKTFYRGYGTPSQDALITDIESGSFTLKRYAIIDDPDNPGFPKPAINDLETKQIQLELRSVRAGSAKAYASNNVVSARYILRNKIVTN